MTAGLFIGRFQPFHNAHLIDIKKALKEVDKLIILIGSAQHSHTKENPFSADERVKMIKSVLQKENIKNYEIYTIADINDDSKWVDHVKKSIPEFDVVYSGNQRVIGLFEENGIPVKKIKLIENLSATLVREKIKKNKKWETDVPKAVAESLKKIKGIKRIKDTTQKVLMGIGIF